MPDFSVARDSNAQRQKVPSIFKALPVGNLPRSCSDLLSELRAPANDMERHALKFDGVNGRDVYNITAPFQLNGRMLLLGRVERRDTEISEIVAFEETASHQWVPCFTQPDFQGLQDPCITWAGDELVLGGVRFPVAMKNGDLGYVMDFYRGKTLETLRHFLRGPLGMKDIRFKQLVDGRVAVFSRPQGLVGGRGEIGFTIAASWESISADLIVAAPLFGGQLLKEEWGGVNEAHLLANGRLGVLGHIACFDGLGHRHYYPMAFAVDPKTREPSPIRIIAQRSFFPPGSSKRPDLVDVVFSGGIVRNNDGTVNLYAGTSDASAAVVKLPDPFLQYEIA